MIIINHNLIFKRIVLILTLICRLAKIHKSTIGGYAKLYNSNNYKFINGRYNRFPETDKHIFEKANGSIVIFNCLKEKTDPNLCPQILGDYTPRYLTFLDRWQHKSYHNNMTEPLYITPHKIYALNPSSKIILIVRDPTERLFSSYNYFMPKLMNE